eukprot:363205-Chlamydomonas_euryale.AAC.19
MTLHTYYGIDRWWPSESPAVLSSRSALKRIPCQVPRHTVHMPYAPWHARLSEPCSVWMQIIRPLPTAYSLKLVLVFIQRLHKVLDALAFPNVADELAGLRVGVQRVGLQGFPVVEHTLRERLSRRRGTQRCGEAERLNDWQVALDVVHGRAGALHLLKDDAALLVHDRIDSAQCALWRLDLHQVDWLQKPGLRSQLGGVHHAAACGDDLATPAMDGISVHDHIV